MGFLIARTKSGEAAFGTLSPRTQRLVLAYVESLGVTLLDDAPIFRSRGFTPGAKGSRPRAGIPYAKDALVDDFAELRTLVFGAGEKRRLMDMRRSGAVEANAGGASVEAISAKMATRSTRTRRCRRPICRSISRPSARPMPRAAKAANCSAWNATNTKS
ncbi:hypothetical protein [Mesorhizobium sp. M0296]|uniref:hypothetical protein n=1 Tax=Mesorhizobium sp. M0296 TaxID=2956931 RepID=UPI00333BBD37